MHGSLYYECIGTVAENDPRHSQLTFILFSWETGIAGRQRIPSGIGIFLIGPKWRRCNPELTYVKAKAFLVLGYVKLPQSSVCCNAKSIISESMDGDLILP